MFLAYLSGIETFLYLLNLAMLFEKFLAYLSGIETNIPIKKWIEEGMFLAYLSGIETGL